MSATWAAVMRVRPPGRSPGRASRARRAPSRRPRGRSGRARRARWSTPSCSAMRAKCACSSATRTRRRSKRWQRDRTVIGTLRISVVANTNFTCGGGSSSVFSSALKALRDSMWIFVDDEDLGAGLDRAVAGGLDDLAHVVDAGAGGGVHLDHVGVAVGQDGDAVGADAAGIGGGAAGAVGADAVQRAGDDAGGGGLSDAADAGQHEGVRDAAEWRRRCAGCAPSPPARSGRRSVVGRYLRASTR